MTMTMNHDDGQSGSGEERQEPPPSFATLAIGYIALNLIYSLAVISAVLILSAFFYPRTIGLYCGVFPYLIYTQVLCRSDEFDGSKRWEAFGRHFPVFQIARKYLRLEIHEPLPAELSAQPKHAAGDDDDDDDDDDDGPPPQNYVFAVFPHGINGDYRAPLDGMLYDALPHGVGRRVRSLVATVLFKLPVVREICLWTGCVDARRSAAEKLLDRRHSLLVVPGGEAEQIRTAYGRERVYLKRRKGFVKLAMRKGVPVVPVYVFGCSDAYRTSHALFGPRNWLVKNLGVCVTFATGKWGSPCCPFPVRHTVVFGSPVDVAEGVGEAGNPTSDELDAAHASFCRALRTLFDEHKGRLGYGDRELEIM